MNNFNELDEKRKKYYKNVKIFGIVAGICFVGAIAGLFLEIDVLAGICGSIAVISFIVLGVNTSNFKKLAKDFKSNHLKNFFETTYPDCIYEPSKGIEAETVYNSGLISLYDIYDSEDLVVGTINGVKYRTSDVHVQKIEHHTDSKGHSYTTYVTTFKGRFFEFDFNKPVDNSLYVMEAVPSQLMLKKSIKLESMDFNKKFKTYCKSKETAFYILTPHLMEHLLEFEKKNKGSCGFSFIGEKLFVSVDGAKDSFELSISKPINEDIFASFNEEFKVIGDVINELKLNNRIYKGE